MEKQLAKKEKQRDLSANFPETSKNPEELSVFQHRSGNSLDYRYTPQPEIILSRRPLRRQLRSRLRRLPHFSLLTEGSFLLSDVLTSTDSRFGNGSTSFRHILSCCRLVRLPPDTWLGFVQTLPLRGNKMLPPHIDHQNENDAISEPPVCMAGISIWNMKPV